MSPPLLYSSSLMRMSGERTGRYWMEIDPAAPKPSAAAVLWLFVLVFGVVLLAALVQAAGH
jgi:hypothetical protein